MSRLTIAAPFIVAALGALLLVLLRGAVPFPLVSDNAYFLPASWWMAETGQLANPWLQPGFNEALNWHGFLQPWLVGGLSGLLGGGWTGTYGAINLLAALTVLSVALAARGLGLSPLRAAALVLVAIALMLDARSRPEVLATAQDVGLVWLAAGLARRFPQGLWHGAGIGALMAALAATHPAVAVFSGFAVAAFLAVEVLRRRPSPGSLAALALAMIAGFVLVAALLLAAVFGPAPLTWLTGLADAARITLARTDAQGLLRYFLANRFLPGFGLLALPLVAAAWSASLPPRFTHWRWLRVALALAIGLAGGFLLYRQALRIPATYYNFTGVLVALGLMAALRAHGRWRWPVDAALMTLGLAALAGIGLWSAQALAERPLIAPSRLQLAQAVASDHAARRRICADAAVLAALDDPELARSVHLSLRLAQAPGAPDPALCDVHYQLQASGGSAATPVTGFLAADAAEQVSPFARLGLRPSHFGFTRWLPQPAPSAAQPGDQP
ncbi:hypothetical protein [Oryzibacter oryziterrae]|uniref:hypothetical protein n=1 Tax=Oryzibacter oryziterrae TaxID=2766474 RepID=UPI001F1E9C37|nr:hypothetical protein [Oryzibacter oryziterrae]